MDGATASIGMELEALQVIASPPTMLPKSEVDAVNLSSLGNILCCPITHELFIDPVLAEDGRTYEKEAITIWLSKRYTSPLDPSKVIRPSRLVENRVAKEAVEAFVRSPCCEKALSESWREAKKAADLKRAREMFDDGRIHDAAKLGLPEAQRELAERYYYGYQGCVKDPKRTIEWATLAAASGDLVAQFMLGYCYANGEGTEDGSPNWAIAVDWYTRSASQGCGESTWHIGVIYCEGGHGIEQNFEQAVMWFRKGVDQGDPHAMYELGKRYLAGEGVDANSEAARGWFEMAAARGVIDAKLRLGAMLVGGIGGSVSMAEGIALLGRTIAGLLEEDDDGHSDAFKHAANAFADLLIDIRRG